MEKDRLGHGISLLVPVYIGKHHDRRAENWEWLKKYWEHHLPGAEIIIGADEDAEKKQIPFSKSVAVNHAACKAEGDIFVIIDADAYVSVETILRAAYEIRLARTLGHKLWLIPYRRLFRLTDIFSIRILESDHKNPHRVSSPPRDGEFVTTAAFSGAAAAKRAHWYGAMIQIMPRKPSKLLAAGTLDSEVGAGKINAAMVAMDALYSHHKTLPDQILHLWHPVTGFNDAEDASGKRRFWENQTGSNSALSSRYYHAKGHPHRMRRLLDEFKDEVKCDKHWKHRKHRCPCCHHHHCHCHMSC